MPSGAASGHPQVDRLGGGHPQDKFRVSFDFSAFGALLNKKTFIVCIVYKQTNKLIAILHAINKNLDFLHQ